MTSQPRRVVFVGLMFGICAPVSVAQTVRVAPIVRQVPTPDPDTRLPGDSPPESLAQVGPGQPFYVELWATNSAAPQAGLACVYVDLNYNPTSLIDAVEPPQDSPLFPIDAVSAVFDDPQGNIATTGGCQTIPVVEMLGVGEWVLVERIEMIPQSEGGPITVTVGDSNDIIAATSIIGELIPVSPDDIEFQSRTFYVGDPASAPVPTATPFATGLFTLTILAAATIASPRASRNGDAAPSSEDAVAAKN